MWGDVDATREDVQMAVENDNGDELLELMPAASDTILKRDVELLPALWDMVHTGQLPAIADRTDQQEDQSKFASYHNYHNNHKFDTVSIYPCDRCQDRQRDMRAMGCSCTKGKEGGVHGDAGTDEALDVLFDSIGG